jgi:peptidoglycan hydrolase CwlO-like protein
VSRLAKITCVILGLIVSALGIMELVSFSYDAPYIYFAVIALGILGVLVGIYARQGGKTDARLQTENATLKKDIEHLKKELSEEKAEVSEKVKELDKLSKEIEKGKSEAELLTKKIEDLKRKEAAKE